MTKETFIRVQKTRGYFIEDFGKMVILTAGKYRAIWFFNADGSVDENNPPTWNIDRK